MKPPIFIEHYNSPKKEASTEIRSKHRVTVDRSSFPFSNRLAVARHPAVRMAYEELERRVVQGAIR